MTEPPFEPEAVLAALHRHGVRYVLIGGLAAVLHGSANVTLDVDVVPELSDENLGRLSEALTDLEARVRVEGIDGGLPFPHDADSLRGMFVLNVTTTAGDVDLTQSPDGVGDH